MQSGFLMLEGQDVESELRWSVLLARMYRSARAAHPGKDWRDGLFALRLFLRQCFQFRDLRAWHRGDNTPLQEMLAWRPSLIAAVKRPYINAEWGASQRLATIEAHYRQLAGRARHLRLVPGAMVRLATLEERGQVLEVTLDSPAWFVHEGELSLNLFLAGERIYTLVFSLGTDAGRPTAFIGAVQGLGSAQALEIYRTLTHALHGLRPRDLLLATFRMVCREIGVQQLLAISDGQRVSASPYFGASARVFSSYDAAWKDHRGERRSDGFWVLPTEVARRSPDVIPSRKRSEYRQRYEMLDRLQASLTQALHARARA